MSLPGLLRQVFLEAADGHRRGIERRQGKEMVSKPSVTQRARAELTLHRYIKSDMLKSLDDDVIDQTCDRFTSVPDGCSESSRTAS